MPVWPGPGLMALASIDVWARMLIRHGAWKRVGWRYWPRLMVGLGTSMVGTLLTLPERVVCSVLMPGKSRLDSQSVRRKRDGQLKIVFVLGYYRSGTTHLHYLLSCNPAFVTPRWHQVIAPAGFVMSWWVVRWLLIPFLGSTRPQDDVAIGPEWPAEDDFALTNLNVSGTLTARMIFPGLWDRYEVLNDYERATEGDRRRFERAMRGFVRKLEVMAKVEGWLRRVGKRLRGDRGKKERDLRVILLKTPSHTARVGMLTRIFGADRVRFIHLSRRPGAVVRSNVAMHGRFGAYVLEDLAGDDEIRERVVGEYGAMERRFVEDAKELAAGSVTRMRYEDLVADPIREVQRCLGEIGIDCSDEFEERMRRYLARVKDYRASNAGKRVEETPRELEWIEREFGHEEGVAQSKSGASEESQNTETATEESRSTGSAGGGNVWEGVRMGVMAAALLGAAWLGVAWVMWDRIDALIWPVGVVIGWAAVRAAGAGSRKLGAVAAACTLMAAVVTAYPATALTSDYREREPMPWGDVWVSTRRGMTAQNNVVWMFLGVVSAFRLGARRQVDPPGA